MLYLVLKRKLNMQKINSLRRRGSLCINAMSVNQSIPKSPKYTHQAYAEFFILMHFADIPFLLNVIGHDNQLKITNMMEFLQMIKHYSGTNALWKYILIQVQDFSNNTKESRLKSCVMLMVQLFLCIMALDI